MTAYKPRQCSPTHTLREVKSKNAGKIFVKPNPTIMASLPHDLIMRIVRQADGGKNAHKLKLNKVLAEFHKPSDVNDNGAGVLCPEFLNEFKNSVGDGWFWIDEFQNQHNQKDPDNPVDYREMWDPYMGSDAFDSIIIDEPFSIIARYWWGGFHEEQQD